MARIPIRLQFADGHVETKRAYARSFEHGDLCRAFGLDPVSHWFDMPSTVYGDKARVGAGDNTTRNISGYVLRHGKHVGTVHVMHPDDKHRDLDPLDQRDMMSLDQTRR